MNMKTADDEPRVDPFWIKVLVLCITFGAGYVIADDKRIEAEDKTLAQTTKSMQVVLDCPVDVTQVTVVANAEIHQ